jgi:hypothetical protein
MRTVHKHKNGRLRETIELYKIALPGSGVVADFYLQALAEVPARRWSKTNLARLNELTDFLLGGICLNWHPSANSDELIVHERLTFTQRAPCLQMSSV